MPSLNAKRQVRYTQADINAIDSAKSVLEFMREFDKAAPVGASISILDNIARHIELQRTPKPVADKAEKKPDAA